MSEYSNVEAPFLQKLRETHWKVIDQGQGIPQDPAKSKRTSFGEVALRGVFLESVGKLNPWATEEQLQYCYERVLIHSEKLFEVNKAVFQMLRKGITLPGKNVGTAKVTMTGGDTPETEYSFVEVTSSETIDSNNMSNYIIEQIK